MAPSDRTATAAPPSDNARFLGQWARPHAHEFGRVIDRYVVEGADGVRTIPLNQADALNRDMAETFARLATRGSIGEMLAVSAAASMLTSRPADQAFLVTELAVLGLGNSAAIGELVCAVGASEAL